jgi:hypothetical protein
LSIAAYFVFGVFGIYIFNLGRKRQKPVPIISGIVLMIYPYFVENPLWLWLIGLGVLAIGIRSLVGPRL